MKNLVFFGLLSFLFFSCGTKHYVFNSRNNPRPTSNYKFQLDKKDLIADVNSVIDTNSIYLTISYRRMQTGISGVYYRFLPNGVVYEVALKGESIQKAVKDTAMGLYGKYRIIKPNRIKMEFIFQLKDPHAKKPIIVKKFQGAKIKGDNLYLNPIYHSEVKGFYRETGKVMQGAGQAGGYLAVLAAPVVILDAIIPDKKVCFYRVDVENLDNYLANH